MNKQDYPLKELGEFLKNIRKKKKITAKDLGIKIGYSQSHISGVENGQKKIPDNKFLEDYLSKLVDTTDEYNFYVREIKEISNNQISLTERIHPVYDSMKRSSLPYEFNFINFKSKPEITFYDIPINDIHFHLKDINNFKFYKNIEMSETDKKNIEIIVDGYFKNKLNIQKAIKNQISNGNLNLENLNTLNKDIEDKL